MSTTTKSQTLQREAPGGSLKEAEDSFLSAFLEGVDAVEKAGLSAMEVPLTVLSNLGMSDDATEQARKATRSMADVVFGTIDLIAAGSLKIADFGLTLVTGTFSAVKKVGGSAAS